MLLQQFLLILNIYNGVINVYHNLIFLNKIS